LEIFSPKKIRYTMKNIPKHNGPYHDTLIKFNHDSNYLGDEFISFW
jgi:hypothetical protein